jgi:putative oxidoreductase
MGRQNTTELQYFAVFLAAGSSADRVQCIVACRELRSVNRNEVSCKECVVAGSTPDHKPPSSLRNPMSYIVIAGRLLYSAVFITAGFEQMYRAQETIAAAAKQGVPLANIAVPAAAVIAIFGGVSILLGYYARVGAWLLVLFLVPVTLMLHNFWAVKNPTLAQTEQIMFMKNMSMLGGALLIAYFGSGPLSLDARRKKV